MKNQFIELVEEAGMKTEVPEFTIGDQVQVHQRILEGEKERIQVFEGVVISMRGDGIAKCSRCGASSRTKASSGRFRCTRRRSPRWK